MSLDIKIIKKENYIYSVELKGSIDTETSPQFKKELTEIIDEKTKAVILNMGEVDYVSSMGLGVIVWLRKALKKEDAVFTMINIQPQIQKLFDVMKLAPNIRIHDMPVGDKYLKQIIKEGLEKQNM
jgi:anti-anti-sigma factor